VAQHPQWAKQKSPPGKAVAHKDKPIGIAGRIRSAKRRLMDGIDGHLSAALSPLETLVFRTRA
jgi:hypothetical protein